MQMTSSCVPKCELRDLRQVESMVDMQTNAIAILTDKIGMLRERLQGVMRDCPTCTGSGATRESLVPLADYIRNNTDKIEICYGMIIDVLDRLEIG